MKLKCCKCRKTFDSDEIYLLLSDGAYAFIFCQKHTNAIRKLLKEFVTPERLDCVPVKECACGSGVTLSGKSYAEVV